MSLKSILRALKGLFMGKGKDKHKPQPAPIPAPAPAPDPTTTDPVPTTDPTTTTDPGATTTTDPGTTTTDPAPAPAPAPEPAPAPTPSPIGAQLLTPSDLVYARTIKLGGTDPYGSDFSFNTGAFAGYRDANGRRVGIVQANPVKFDAAILVDLDSGATIGRLDNLCQGLRPNSDPTDTMIVTGYRVYNGELYVLYHYEYNVDQSDDPCLVIVNLATMAARGPYRIAPDSHHTGGYGLVLPDGRLACGSMLTSGNGSASWGPNLHAVSGPLNGDQFPTETQLLYPFLGLTTALNRCTRDPDYIVDQSNPSPVEIVPVNGIGYWTSVDFVGGGEYINTGDKVGLVFGGHLGHGAIWYAGPDATVNGRAVHDESGVDTKGPHCETRSPALWIVDPAVLGSSVATDGKVIPTCFQPTLDPLGSGGNWPKLAGMWFDTPARELFILCPEAWNYAEPVIHVLRVA